MKKLLLILFLFPLLAFGQKVKGFLGSDEYNVANESYIKFNFQKHSDENTTYKFKFFQDVSGIEFWAHHSVDASIENGNISADLEGNIDSLDLNNYLYRDINLSGYLSNRIFDGLFSVSDPNIKMDFKGKIDFSDEIPVFDFTADVMIAFYESNVFYFGPCFDWFRCAFNGQILDYYH